VAVARGGVGSGSGGHSRLADGRPVAAWSGCYRWGCPGVVLQVFWGFWVACRVLSPQLAMGVCNVSHTGGVGWFDAPAHPGGFPVDPYHLGGSVTLGEELLEASAWDGFDAVGATVVVVGRL